MVERNGATISSVYAKRSSIDQESYQSRISQIIYIQ